MPAFCGIPLGSYIRIRIILIKGFWSNVDGTEAYCFSIA